MKPEILTVTNIGPFVGKHEIDFTNYDSIFLVSGKTGAGKTTIFDAISYVFFSRPQGARAQILRSMRSQFASDSETAEVELIFTMGNDRYKIFRRLPFLKPGHKHESPEEVSLAEFKNNEWKDLSDTNKRETDKKIANIIKLSEKEFMRIVLLPQGKFAEFLRENSNQKKETLAQLFPISKYTELMELAKEKEKAEKEKIQYIESSIKNIDKNFSIDAYKIEREKLINDLELSKKNYLQASEKIRKKSEELREAKILKQKQKEFNEVVQEINAIELHQDSIAKMKEQIQKAQKALSLSSQANSIKKLNISINENKIDIENKIKSLNTITENLKKLKEEKPIIEKDREKALELKHKFKVLERAKEIEKELEEKNKKLEDVKVKKNTSETKLKNIETEEKELEETIISLEKILENFDERNQNYENANNELTYKKRILEISKKNEEAQKLFSTHTKAANKIKEELETGIKDCDIEKNRLQNLEEEEKFEQTMQKAATIAINLKEDEACPVCGSTQHPKLAVSDGNTLYSIQEKIKSCKRNIEKLINEKENLDKSYSDRKRDSEIHKMMIEECKSNLKNLNNEHIKYEFQYQEIPELSELKNALEESTKKYQQASKEINEAQQANTSKLNYEKKLKTIKNQKEKYHNELTELKLEETSIASSKDEKEKQYKESFKNLDKDIIQESIDETIENCKAQILLLDRKVNNYEETLSENNNRQSSLKNSINEKKEQMEKWEASEKEESKVLEEGLKKKGFSSIDELFDSLLDEETIKEQQAEIDHFNQTQIMLKQKKAGLELDLKNKEIIDPEIIEDALSQLQKLIDEEHERTSQANARLAQIDEIAKQRENLIKELKEKSQNAETISLLSKNINGDNKFRLKFDIWVLSAFLREITNFANTRLEKMSNGRFILKVSEEIRGNNLSGLDLEIFDIYTGLKRPTASLSGGETFTVSISLALGLADSIQSRNGGIKLDSMFIDEGFGTLDDATLENCISILDEIRGERMVGIISHVSELQTRIPNKIYVKKTKEGSHIEYQN